MNFAPWSLAVLALFLSTSMQSVHAQARFDEDGTKFCSVIIAGDWRDTINVPKAWTVEDCEEFRVAMGASAMQIGCIFERGRSAFSIAEASFTPRPNCGWEAPRRTERITRGTRDGVADWEIIIERSRRR